VIRRSSICRYPLSIIIHETYLMIHLVNFVSLEKAFSIPWTKISRWEKPVSSLVKAYWTDLRLSLVTPTTCVCGLVPSLALPFSSARASKWPAAQPVLSVICRMHPRWWWIRNRGYFCVCIILYTPTSLSDTHHSWHSQQQQRKSLSLHLGRVVLPSSQGNLSLYMKLTWGVT